MITPKYNEILQEKIDEKMNQQYYMDMRFIVGIETAEMAAFISVMQDQIILKLEEFPEFPDKMKELADLRQLDAIKREQALMANDNCK